MTSYSDTDCLCPFYVTNGELEIRCEGVISRTRCNSKFPNKAAKENHMDRFCRDDYRRCRLCRTLEEKYDESGNEK